MNSPSQAKLKFLPAWDDTKVINSIQQHYILYSYTLHKKNLDTSKKMVDNSEPMSFKEKQEKLTQTKSRFKLQPLNLTIKNKPERNKTLEQDIENGSLINRMMQITEKGSLYNKNTLDKQVFKPNKHNFAIHRQKEADKVNTENLFIHNRLEKVQSTINFNKYEQSYDKYKKYKDNITRSSRRIFNCFIKTDFNQELLATTSTAYGRLIHAKTTTSRMTPTPTIEEKPVQKSKPKKKKSKHSKNNKSQENLKLLKFPDDTTFYNSKSQVSSRTQAENFKESDHFNQRDTEQKSKRSSQITTKSDQVKHSKKNSISEKLQQNAQISEEQCIKIIEEEKQLQSQQEESKIQTDNQNMQADQQNLDNVQKDQNQKE
ncbi:hypothetical protein ABPG72_004671 [Tetrahymena utriculariae]